MFHVPVGRMQADAQEARYPDAPLRETGGWLDAAPLRRFARSIAFNLLVGAKALGNALSGKRGPAIWFRRTGSGSGDSLRAAIAWGGMRVVASPEEADLACHFMGAGRSRPINARCRDISSTAAARTFHRAFGYPLQIDPARYVGWAVEKSDAGPRDDCRLVACPVVPRAGRSYQKWIDASDGECVADLRTHCIGGRPVIVWVESRRERDRFTPGAAIRTDCVAPDAVFSDEELLAIEQFVRLIGLDWGTLDILRCRADRRLYVVDVETTDVEPIADLPMRAKLESTRLLADLLTIAARRFA